MSDIYISSIVLETNILNPTPESKKTFTRSSGGLTPFYRSDGLEIIIWETYFNPFTEENETKWRLRGINNPSGGSFVSLNLNSWSVQPGYVTFASVITFSLGYKNRNLIKGGGTGKLIGKSFIRKIIISNAQNGGNGVYIRNGENDIFIGPFDPEFNLYCTIRYFPNYFPNQGVWSLDRDETYYISSDLINWQDGAFFWGNGSAQIFYKP